MGETLRGVVKWFNDAKGFGFIEHSSGRDVFVHYSVIEWDGFKTLKDGEEVDYELKEGEKGLHAARVGRPNVAPKKTDEPSQDAQEISSQAQENSQHQLKPEVDLDGAATASGMEVEIDSVADSAEKESPVTGVHASTGSEPLKVNR